jgi:hypothetical protein
MVDGVQFHPPPRSIIQMRATLSTVAVVALLAAGAGAGGASARTDTATGRADAARRAAAMRAQGLHDARRPAAQSLHDERLAAVASSREPSPAPSVRVTRVADGGFDWADAGIGAGLTAALLLSAAGVSTLRRQHTPATR